MKYHLLLSPFQVEILLETVEAFVDNQKLLHIPNKEGDIVALPLTKDALLFIKDQMNDERTEIEIDVAEDSGNLATVSIQITGVSESYQVDLNDFDVS
ncbi:hypothetical protein [Ammoniphilus resinae]|uniref:Uncharacterized protein n=1 Tax=Ammoniphilus resinae TaxID=861532 RepID=A0ABS4GR17_9BACL|nr:hypothetical protein [Ammoniphilus resinae]MBP1932691.1 hypothetical protein [Ammoniphilus resinae]